MAKVLLVEDDNNLREIFEMRLQAEGYSTAVASNGEEALAVALKEKPDLVIADVMMPKMSGFEMLETLREAPDMANIKVIMMTALGQAEDRERGEKLGVIKYLVKSQVTLEDFVRTVKEVLEPGSANQSGTPIGQSGEVTQSINVKESEKSMDDNTNPTNPAPGGDMPAPGGDSSAPAGDNPVSGDSGQMSTSQQQDTMNGQVNDAMGGSSTPAPADSSAPAGGDMPMGTPPADDGSTPPSDGAGTPPAAGGMPTTPA